MGSAPAPSTASSASPLPDGPMTLRDMRARSSGSPWLCGEQRAVAQTPHGQVLPIPPPQPAPLTSPLPALEARASTSLLAARCPRPWGGQPAGPPSGLLLAGSFHQVGGTLFRKVPQEQVASQSCPLALRTERCQWLGPWSVPSGAGLEAAGNTNPVCHQAGRAGLRGLGHTAGFLTRR